MQGGGCARDLDRQIAVDQRVDGGMQMTAKKTTETQRSRGQKRSEEPKGQAGYVLNLSVRRGRALGPERFLAKAEPAIAPIWKRGIRSRRGCV
jgi:hypothetical protein